MKPNMQPGWKPVDAQFTVAPQIGPADLPAIAAAGFTMVICNRPDGEEPGQPEWETVRAACAAEGLAAEFLPQTGRPPTRDEIDRLLALLEQAGGPVFAYCRSGRRSEYLWTAARAAAGATPAKG